MTCREVLRQLALHLGKDLCEPDVLDEVRQHLKSCPRCQFRSRQIKSSMAVLERSNQPASFDVAGSLWPTLEARLNEPRPGRLSLLSVHRWAPAATAVAAGLLLVVTLNSTLPRPGRHSSPSPEFHSRDFSVFPMSRPVPPAAPAPHPSQQDLKERAATLKKSLNESH